MAHWEKSIWKVHCPRNKCSDLHIIGVKMFTSKIIQKFHTTAGFYFKTDGQFGSVFKATPKSCWKCSNVSKHLIIDHSNKHKLSLSPHVQNIKGKEIKVTSSSIFKPLIVLYSMSSHYKSGHIQTILHSALYKYTHTNTTQHSLFPTQDPFSHYGLLTLCKNALD